MRVLTIAKSINWYSVDELEKVNGKENIFVEFVNKEKEG